MSKLNRHTAQLGAYDFSDIHWAYTQLWSSVRSLVSWLPEKLSLSDWSNELVPEDRYVVAQYCGWPLVSKPSFGARVVGTFRHTTPQSASHFYRSVICARVDGTPFDFQGCLAAVNDQVSLSGWISLIAAIHGPQEVWRGGVKISGSHLESIKMLCRGQADVASIDSVSFAHIKRTHPQLVSQLFIICNGPLVPCLPIITDQTTTDDQIAQLRYGFHAATNDPQLAPALGALYISGFDSLDFEDYLPLLELTPNI